MARNGDERVNHGAFGEAIRQQMRARLQERDADGGTVEKGSRRSGPRVQDRASQAIVDSASSMFGRALSPTAMAARKEARSTVVEKAKPHAAEPAAEPAPVAAASIKNAEHTFVAGGLDFFIEKMPTLSPEVRKGLEMLRDKVAEEIQ